MSAVHSTVRLLPLLVCLSACGHTMKVGAGPLVDSRGRAGLEASLELGKHLVGAPQAAEPVAVRLEASTTGDTAQAIIGLAFGLNLPAGGRRAKPDDQGVQHGWGGRLSLLGAGLALDDSGDATMAMRGGLALTRGSMHRGGREHAGCLGSHEKSSLCIGWQEWRFSQVGVEVASALYFESDDDSKLDLVAWRVAAEVIYERGALKDLD